MINKNQTCPTELYTNEMGQKVSLKSPLEIEHDVGIKALIDAMYEGIARQISDYLKKEAKTPKPQKITFRISQQNYDALTNITKMEGISLSQLLDYATAQFIDIYHSRQMLARAKAIEKAEILKSEFESFPIEVQKSITAREAQEPETERIYERAIKLTAYKWNETNKVNETGVENE